MFWELPTPIFSSLISFPPVLFLSLSCILTAQFLFCQRALTGVCLCEWGHRHTQWMYMCIYVHLDAGWQFWVSFLRCSPFLLLDALSFLMVSFSLSFWGIGTDRSLVGREVGKGPQTHNEDGEFLASSSLPDTSLNQFLPLPAGPPGNFKADPGQPYLPKVVSRSDSLSFLKPVNTKLGEEDP